MRSGYFQCTSQECTSEKCYMLSCSHSGVLKTTHFAVLLRLNTFDTLSKLMTHYLV